jgi:hypothetical protein
MTMPKVTVEQVRRMAVIEVGQSVRAMWNRYYGTADPFTGEQRTANVMYEKIEQALLLLCDSINEELMIIEETFIRGTV